MKTIIKDNSRKLPSIVIAPILSPSLISDDEDRKSRLGSVDMEDDDPSRLVTKSVMKNQIDKIAEGNPTLVEGEYLKVFMNLFKSSFINKIPIAKDKAVQEIIIHIKRKQNNRPNDVIARLSFLLKSIQYFKDRNISSGEYMLFSKFLEYRYFPTDHTIFNYGQEGNMFYVILQGKVGVKIPVTVEIPDETAKGGIRKEIEVLERLELSSGVGFGEASLLTDELRNATIVTKTECHFATMTKKNYLRMMKHKEGKKLLHTVEFFYNLPYFRDRSTKQLQQMHYVFTQTEVSKHHIVFDVGDKSERVFIILDGEFELEIDIDRYFYGIQYLERDKANNKKLEAGSLHINSHKLKATIIDEKERFKMLKFANMCKGQMVGAEDSLLGRPFTSRLTAKTLDCKLYSCSILEFKRYFGHLPQIMNVIFNEIEQRRKRVCAKLGEFVRIRTYEANHFYESYKRQIREEKAYEPLPLFAEENQLTNINNFLEREENPQQMVSTLGNKPVTSAVNEQALNLERMVDSIKHLHSVVDTVKFSKRNHYHSYNARSYQQALPSRNTGLLKDQRTFFQTIDELELKRPLKISKNLKSSNSTKSLNKPLINPTSTRTTIPITLNVTDTLQEKIELPAKENINQNELTKPEKALNSSSLNKQKKGEIHREWINTEEFMNKYDKRLKLTYLSNSPSKKVFEDSRSKAISGKVSPRDIWGERQDNLKKEEMNNRIQKLTTLIESDGEKVSVQRKREKRLGKPLDNHKSVSGILNKEKEKEREKWGKKTMSKFAEIYRKQTRKNSRNYKGEATISLNSGKLGINKTNKGFNKFKLPVLNHTLLEDSYNNYKLDEIKESLKNRKPGLFTSRNLKKQIKMKDNATYNMERNIQTVQERRKIHF